MSPAKLAVNFSMRTEEQEQKDWKEGARLLSIQLGLKVSVSDFVRIATREKLEHLKATKKGGR